jgi:hypothetical protein
LDKEEKVIIGEESGVNWPNWVFCTKMDGSSKGWVPKQIIKFEKNYGYTIENYSAKELNIEKGYILNCIKELNGWSWCKCENTNEIGWVPNNNIKILE